MDIIKSYRKYIVENKSLVLFSFLWILIARLIFYYTADNSVGNQAIAGYLWTDTIALYLQSHTPISALISVVFTLCIILYLGLLNSKHKLIRNRTYLVYIFTSLLFCGHPSFTFMNHQYISTLLILFAIDILLGSYQQVNSSGKAYAIGFTIAFASMFSFSILIYLPVFWVSIGIMRCFSFKTFISSLFGVLTIYWLAFFWFVWQNNTDHFLIPFQNLYPILNDFAQNIEIQKIISLTVFSILFAIIAISYQASSYLDKIQIRASLYIFYVAALCSFLFYIFICYDSVLNFYIFTLNSALLLSHFFTLVDQKWKVHMFYIIIFLYFSLCIYFMLNKLILALLVL